MQRKANMNKHIINSLSQYKFTYDGSRGIGKIDGYEVNVIDPATGLGPIFLFSTYLTQAQKNDFVMKINAHHFKLVQASSFDFGVSVLISAATSKGYEKKIQEVLPVILEALAELQAPKSNICPQSGETLYEEDSQVVTLDVTKAKIRLSNKAVEVVNSMIQKNNEVFADAPNNYLKGFLGVLIGAIAGALLAVLLSLVGFVTVFASLLSIFLGTFLYRKFGGKPDATMIVMSFLTTIVVLFLAIVLLYSAVAANAVREAGGNLGLFQSLAYCVDNSREFKTSFFLDVFLNVVFVLIGEGVSIALLVRMIRRPKNLTGTK